MAQTQVLIRPYDPLCEDAFRLGGSKAEDSSWTNTIECPAGHFGVYDWAQMIDTCVDSRLRWSLAKYLVQRGFKVDDLVCNCTNTLGVQNCDEAPRSKRRSSAVSKQTKICLASRA